MRILSSETALSHQYWGDLCESWVWVDEDSLSVKREKMPAGKSEQIHYHKKARQFFYILRGRAVFEINQERFTVETGQGIYIRPLEKHKISNEGETELEFILSSAPSTRDDRFDCE